MNKYDNITTSRLTEILTLIIGMLLFSGGIVVAFYGVFTTRTVTSIVGLMMWVVGIMFFYISSRVNE